MIKKDIEPISGVNRGITNTGHLHHRVDRVLSFFSSRPNWDSPTPSHAGEGGPPHFGSGGGGGGGHTRLRERGWGSPNQDEGTDTMVL